MSPVRTGRDHPMRAVWTACANAPCLPTVQQRAEASQDAYRMLAESGWDGWRGPGVALSVYTSELDFLIWPNVLGGDG